MLKIRLQRTGKKHKAAYRIVVAEHSAPIKWKFIEKLWSFIASRKEETLNIDLDRARHWISVWAKPSDVVARMLFKKWVKEAEALIEKRVMKPKKEKVVEKPKEEKAPEAPAPEAWAEEAKQEPKEEVKEEPAKEEAKAEPAKEEVKEEPKAEESKEEWKKDEKEADKPAENKEEVKTEEDKEKTEEK